jgi:coatomer subunit alpha
LAEKSYQVIRSLDKLNFLYSAMGSTQKLKKMQLVAGSIGDQTLRFNTSIMIGDVQERVKVLAETG